MSDFDDDNDSGYGSDYDDELDFRGSRRGPRRRYRITPSTRDDVVLFIICMAICLALYVGSEAFQDWWYSS